MPTLRGGVVFASVCLLNSLAAVAACGNASSENFSTPTGDAAPADSAVDRSTAPVDSATPTIDAATKPDADTAAQEKLICDALASRSACPGGTVPCDDSTKCIYGRVMLSAAASVYASCRGAPSCKSDDACIVEAGKAVGGAAADQYANDCVARRTACANVFKGEFCSPAIFAYPGGGAGAQACLARACDQVGTCFKEIQAVKDIAACK